MLPVFDLNRSLLENEDCGTLKIDAWHSGISVWSERVRPPALDEFWCGVKGLPTRPFWWFGDKKPTKP
jgi:hypothetical protein